MNVNEFRNWLRESNYKVTGEYPTYVSYSKGFRYVDLYDNGRVVVTFCSMLEYTTHETNVKDLEKGKADSIKYKVMEEVEGEMKECEFYLYRY